MNVQLLSKSGKLGGAKPVDKSGHSEPKPKTTFVEDIWSAQYCHRNPQNAAQAIKTLQLTLQDRDDEITRLKAILEDIANQAQSLRELIEEHERL